jgi:hypothetical protein
MPPRDPAVERFLARHSKPPREAVEDDVARYRGRSLEQIGEAVSACCRMAVAILDASPSREAILARHEPPHPSYRALIARLRAR